MPPDRLHDRWSRHAPGRVRDRRRPGHRRGHISFGGYLDRFDPEQELIYQAYIDAVAYARSKGTIIVASAGNEHLRIGAGGRVLSHGPTVTPGTAPEDFQDLLASTRPRAGSPAWSTCPRPTGWSSRPRPGALIARLKRLANDGPRNLTRALSATDTSPGDLIGLPCDTGYCHLERPRIPDSEAYGAGLVNVAKP